MNLKEDKTQSEEVKKAREYLLDSRKNIERLKEGKRPRRNLKFFVQDNRKLFYFVSLLLVTSLFIPFMIPDTVLPPFDPNEETVETMVNLVETNFTDQDGYPTNEPEVIDTSSELVILSTLTNSILLQTGYLAYETNNIEKVNLIHQILENSTFRDFSNNSKKLSAQYQLLGFFSLMQAYFALQHSAYSFSKYIISGVLVNIIYDYYSATRSIVKNPNSNTTNLIDQALCICAITMYYLMFRETYLGIDVNGTYYYYDLDDIVDDLFDTMYIEFYNMTDSKFFNTFDTYSNASYDYASVDSLMFLTLGLVKAAAANRYMIYFPVTGYWLHQKIIDDYIDSNWLVHSNDSSDSFLNIRNQAYFSAITYLMNLKNVGVELVNATSTNYLTARGFLENLNEQEVTVESCLYGLMTLGSEKWAIIQLEREIQPTTSPIATPLSGIAVVLSLLSIATLVVIIRRRKFKTRKRKW